MCAALLNIILASFLLTPRQSNNTFVIKCRNDVVPFGDFSNTRIVVILSLLEQIVLNGLEQFRDRGVELGKRNRSFDTGVTTDGESLLLSDIGGADFKT